MSPQRVTQVSTSSTSRLRYLSLCALLAGVLLLALAAPSAPAAAPDLCPFGAGAGQCDQPQGVAIDATTGDFYLADRNNDRVQAFAEDGSFLRSIGAGVLSHPRSVAVDNDPASPSHHDLYVADEASRVLRFSPAGALQLGFGWGVRDGATELQTCGPEATPPTASCLTGKFGKGECQLSEGSTVAVGPGETVYVADSAPEANEFHRKGRIEKFAPDGSCKGEEVLFEGIYRKLTAIAVDSEEDVYLADEQGAGVLKLDPAGSTLCQFGANAETVALTLDPASDHLLAAQTENKARGSGEYRIVAEYAPEPGCPVARRFGYAEIGQSPVRGLAVFPGIVEPSRAGNMLISEGFGSEHKVFQLPQPPPGPIIVPASPVAEPIGNANATLDAEVNPEGKATAYHFDYVTEAQCEADVTALGPGHCFDHATATPDTPIPIAPGTPAEEAEERVSLHAAAAQIGCPDPLTEAGQPANSCLTPETAYRFRVLASNPNGAGNSPQEGAFTTRPPLEFGQIFSTAVATTSAILHAEANPLGIAASARFQIVADVDYQASGFKEALEYPAPAQIPLDLGAGTSLVTRAAAVAGLAPATLYHYRLLVDNPLIEPVGGPERTLTTFPLPASPPPCPANEAFRSGPSALLPDCRAYELVSPLDKANGDVVPLKAGLSLTPAVLVQSSLEGSRFAYGSSTAFGDAPSAPWTSQYIAARGADGWSSHAVSSPIGEPLFKNVFENTETELKALSPDLCQAWVRTISDPPLAPGAQTGFPNLYRREDDGCGGPSYEALTTAKWQNLKPRDAVAVGLDLQGISADGSKAIFVAPDSLAGTGAPKSKEPRLYLWAGGPKPLFACILPGGTPLGGPCSAGFGSETDLGYGRFAAKQGAISADGERVFWTAAFGPGKIYLREAAEQGQVAGECSAGKPCTIAVSAQGEEASGTSASRFIAAASDGSKLIFSTGDDLYEAQIAEEGGHPMLTATNLIAHGLEGAMGVSEDATHVYFASSEAITGSGKDELGEDAKAGEPNLYLHRAGGYAFIGVLSAQDANTSVRGPIAEEPIANLARVAPDGEHAAFLSSAQLTGYDNLDAASGEPDTEVFRYDAAANRLTCASCNPSGSRPIGRHDAGKETILYHGPEWLSGWLGGHETNLYASRELSDDGSRLFFNSTDSLVAGDTNGRADVYQWEAPGTGTCTESSPTYSHQDEGCLDLISSGQSAQDSEFLDASPSGADVFFTTLSSLLVQDYGLIDVYDARVDGGFPPPPTPPASCEGEACQSPPAAPNDPTPASSSFQGAGNVVEKPARKHRRKKHHASKQKKAQHRANHHRGTHR